MKNQTFVLLAGVAALVLYQRSRADTVLASRVAATAVPSDAWGLSVAPATGVAVIQTGTFSGQ